jgi:hypothetical protein
MENKSSNPFLVHAWQLHGACRPLFQTIPTPRQRFSVGFFPQWTEGLFELAHSIVQPGYFVKICGTPDRLREVLPQGWQVHPAAYFMMGTGTSGKHRCPQGYTVEVKQTMAVTHVRIVSETSELAAGAFAMMNSSTRAPACSMLALASFTTFA